MFFFNISLISKNLDYDKINRSGDNQRQQQQNQRTRMHTQARFITRRFN